MGRFARGTGATRAALRRAYDMPGREGVERRRRLTQQLNDHRYHDSNLPRTSYPDVLAAVKALEPNIGALQSPFKSWLPPTCGLKSIAELSTRQPPQKPA